MRGRVAVALITAVAAAWPVPVDPPADFDRACRLLSLRIPSETVLAASYALGVGGSLLASLCLALGEGRLPTVLGVLILVVSGGASLVGRYGIPFAAEATRIRALGTAPSLVTTLVLGATLWPSAERAAEFAAEAGDGLLAEGLDRHRRRADGSPRSGLQTFAAEWDDRFPALERAVGLVESATAAPTDERSDLLSMARRCVLDGTRDEIAGFAAALRAPATALYAFGVLLPLAMASLLPAAAAAGLPVTGPVLVATYGVVLPAALVVACVRVLGRRPVAFPSVPVPRSHPAVPPTVRLALGAGVGAAAGGWLLAGVIVADWARPVAALGAGVGSALVVHYRPITAVRDHVVAVETGLPDLLSAVGRRLDRGQSVEAALAEAVDETPAPTTTVVEAAVARQADLGTSVEGAFLGPAGALSSVPSRRARRVATLLGTAAAVGPPAGESVTTMAEHLDELRAIERETRRDLAQITGTLSNTAALFGPLVGGATVALAGVMDAGGGFNGVPNATLGLVVGWYVLVLAVVLTALSSGLHRGLDRSLVGYRAGLALLSATAVYFAAVVATGLLV